MSTVTLGALVVEDHAAGATMGVTLSGTAEFRSPDALLGELLRIHAVAQGASASEVRIDVSRVDFMSSTSLGAFVGWIAEVQKLAPAERYKLHFIGTKGRRWQRASLHSLAAFAPEHIGVTLLEVPTA